jgi:multimeric flavodoxin WrbA
MKVILINGSPRSNGCTYTALSVVAAELEKERIETEIIQAAAYPVKNCTACRACGRIKNGHCVINDDNVNETSDKIAAADGLIIGSPVHFSSISSLASAFLGRLFYPSYRLPGRFAHKPGAVVVTFRRYGASSACEQLTKYFSVSEMPLVSSMYWNAIYGDRVEDLAKDEEGLQTLKVMGRNMAWVLKCFDTAKASGVSNPPYEEKIKTKLY